jgi:hypothetical protein
MFHSSSTFRRFLNTSQSFAFWPSQPSNVATQGSNSVAVVDQSPLLLVLELVLLDVIPKLFGQFGSGEWVFADHCGQYGVGLHGFAKGVFRGGGFLRGRHRAIRTRRAWLPSEKSTVFQRFAGSLRRISSDCPETVHSRADLGDGVAPDQRRIRAEFPYFGEPYASSQQVAPPAQGSEKK